MAGAVDILTQMCQGQIKEFSQKTGQGVRTSPRPSVITLCITHLTSIYVRLWTWVGPRGLAALSLAGWLSPAGHAQLWTAHPLP